MQFAISFWKPFLQQGNGCEIVYLWSLKVHFTFKSVSLRFGYWCPEVSWSYCSPPSCRNSSRHVGKIFFFWPCPFLHSNSSSWWQLADDLLINVLSVMKQFIKHLIRLLWSSDCCLVWLLMTLRKWGSNTNREAAETCFFILFLSTFSFPQFLVFILSIFTLSCLLFFPLYLMHFLFYSA